MRKCLERYVEADFFTARRRRVVEIGSHDVNGSYRRLFEGVDVDYAGVDMSSGPGVDIVLDDPYKLPMEAGTVDLVLSGQMLEHSEYFWLAFQEMMRVVSADGYLLLIAPSAGPIHRYPVDCYRFYPDAYRALAKLTGCHVVALWLDERGPWRDLTGIFSKNPAAAGRKARRPAYVTQNNGPFADRPEAEIVAGQEDYHDTLRRIHDVLQPRRYLEIGVRTGSSLDIASCPSMAVEPEPMPRYTPPASCQLFELSSDDFFEAHAKTVKNEPPDLVFIDGMHLFEFVLRDFMSVERNANPGTCVVIDDIFPTHPAQATRKRTTKYWTGDVWKIIDCLEKYRPDLQLIRLDTSPTGLLLILGLNPDNLSLWNKYNAVLATSLRENATPPPAILERQRALDPRHPGLSTLGDAVRGARDRADARQAIVAAVRKFRLETAAK